jgi:hypothetical protein
MSKRGIEEVEEAVPEETDEDGSFIQRARELYAEKKDQIVNVYVCRESMLKRILKKVKNKNPNQTVKGLRNPHSIHKVHPQVLKQKKVLTFTFCPAELASHDVIRRCFVPLTNVLDILPSNEEVENLSSVDRNALDPKHFVLHSFEVSHSFNNSPFQILFRSNMFDVVLEALNRFKSGERMMRAVSNREPLLMPDTPGHYGVLVLDPNSDIEYKEGLGVCVNPFGYIEPENTRVALTTSDTTNANGIVWIDWRSPDSPQTGHYGVLSKDHVLTMAARANFDEYFINIVALDEVEDEDEYFTLMPADVAKHVSDEFVERQVNTVPVCDTDRVVFEICRQIGGTDWLSRRGGAGIDDEQFEKTYDVIIEFDMRYTLLSNNVGTAVVTMPTAALPATAMETELELREAIDRQVAEQVNEELTTFSLEKLRVDNEQ